MTDWKPRRFWKSAAVVPLEEGYEVRLDDRPLRTPGKSPLIVPSEDMARAIAEEWDAQEEVVDPGTMPVTRSANSAIEKTGPARAEVAAMLAAYAETDLLCYRAEGPEALAARQSEGWDPVLDWAAERFGARLVPTAGVLPVAQDAEAIAALKEAVDAYRPFSLTALHDLVTLSGSLVLGLAVAEGERAPEEAWRLSRIDEDWQVSQWGEDAEASAAAAAKQTAFLHAARFLTLSRGQ